MKNLKRDIRWLMRGPVHIAAHDNNTDGFGEFTFYWCWPMSKFTRLFTVQRFHNWSCLCERRTGYEFRVRKLHIEVTKRKED
jgi:hypothetical protein